MSALGPDAWPWFPGTLPYRAAGFAAESAPLTSTVLGLLSGLATGVLGIRELSRRDVV